MKKVLTDRQSRFVDEYLKDLNATQAYIRIGGSAKTADVQGPRMLGLVRIRSEVDRRLANIAKKSEITVESVLRMIIEDRQAAIDAGQFNVAVKADELLGKHTGAFRERIELSGGLEIDVTLVQLSELARSK